MNFKGIHFASKLFQPLNVTPKNSEIKYHEISHSQKLMLDLGIIRGANPGCFHLLPLGVRALDKLISLVDNEMSNINCQKVILPYLTSAKLWKVSGRLASIGNELFTLKDRHNRDYVLSPTYEESISDLLASVSPLSYKQLPLKLYQITSKFRDEIKPRFGLMRSRQFVMKDLYSFDTSVETARITYDQVCSSYDSIFKKLGVDYVKVLGTTGNIGGLLSHEYHFPASIGEDELIICKSCGFASNKELNKNECCSQCNQKSIEIKHGIEVGHTFLLGDCYSAPLKATYLSSHRKPFALQMGCYGLGLSRILAAALEVLIKNNELRWPLCIAPYKILIIPPKEGSKEEENVSYSSQNLYKKLSTVLSIKDDILIDDRTKLTIGKRLLEAKKMGYPFIIVIGASATQTIPKYELFDLSNDNRHFFTDMEIIDFIQNNIF